jgi:hypothetical protein
MFDGLRYPLYGTPSQGGNIYPQLDNPYHTFVSSQTCALVMVPIQTSMDQLGEGYYLSGHEQGVNQDPSWLAMFQNQSFLGPWYQIPQLTTTISPVTSIHTRDPSQTTTSHVGDWSTTSVIHVEDPQPIIASHAGGITLVTTSHTDVTSPTSIHHVGDESLASASHAESMSLAIVNDAGGMHTIEKPRRLRRKPKFLCRTCEGNHLTRLCPATTRILEACFSPKVPLGSEAFVVSPHPISTLIDIEVMPMKSSPDHTPIVKGDVSPISVIVHPLQPMVEELVIPVQPLVNPTLLLEGDASFNHVVSISDTTPFEKERVLLS